MDWIWLTPESITGVAQVALAVILALYLFRIPNKTRVLWLLAFSLLGETIHHAIKFVEFSFPYLYPSVGGLLFLPSFAIYVLIITFAYHFKGHIYKRESSIVIPVSVILGLIILGFICFVFFSSKPHNEIYGSSLILYAALFYLLFTSSWGIIILVRKAIFFRNRYKAAPQTPSENLVGNKRYTQPDMSAMRSCIGFSVILSIKIVILLSAALSEYEIITATTRIYANLILHVIYLCGLTVVIMDHIQHPTSLQAKLIGITLSLALLILSASALTTHSTQALLERALSLVQDQQMYLFNPNQSGGYTVTHQPYTDNLNPGEPVAFEQDENLSIPLPFEFTFNQQAWDSVFVNKNGVVAFGHPFVLEEEDEFFMSQTYHHYTPTISRQFLMHDGLIAPLLIRTRNKKSDSLFISQGIESITLTWKYVQQNIDRIAVYVNPNNQHNSFSLTLYRDGSFTLAHIDINAFVYDGVIGYYHSGLEAGSTVQYANAYDSSTFPVSATHSYVIDNFQQFRSGIHDEVTRMLWILLGSIVLIFTILPLISRTSIFIPLAYLREGSRKIEQGELQTRVPVLTKDEIGYVAYHFNKMATSLQDAQQNLMSHNENLEKEVSLRTEEVTRQKHQIEIQARELMEMDEIKSRFFANISHEFRTPLNLIMGPVQLALQGKYGDLDPTLQQHYHVILNESQRLLKLINQLLDLSKFDAGMLSLNTKPTDLVELLDRIVRNFSSRASMEGKTLHFHPELAHLTAPFDQDKIENVCYNLLDNAFKFTSAGGKIRVSLAIEIKDQQPQARLSIQDTGTGIPPEQLTRIFDRFHQVDISRPGSIPGTGIGLALVEKLIHLHKGHIQVESQPGFGSTFTVYLPIPDEYERADLYEANPNQALVLDAMENLTDKPQSFPHSLRSSFPLPNHDEKTPLVLVVDDDEKFRALLREYLLEYYQIEEAAHGVEGLKKARSRPPQIIISDVMMPEMDGIQFCEAVKSDADLDHIPFIMLTAKASIESRIEGIEKGADDYLAKPFHPDELHALIKNRLEQRKHLIEKYADLLRLESSDIVVDSAEAAFIKDVMRSIEKNIDDNLYSVERLAEDVEVSVRDLQRKLRKLIAKTPKDLILHTRIDRAKQLLAQRYGTNQQIARLVGFRRADHFAKVFKKYTGLTPGEYSNRSNTRT